MPCHDCTRAHQPSGYFREKVSAAAFLVVATVCKIVTVVMSEILWPDSRVPPEGLAGLLLCVLGGALYKQPPERPAVTESLVSLRDLEMQNGERDTDMLLATEPPHDSHTKRLGR